ncbi:MAG: DUF1501 domain-containing protein [Akkermansiaceae bacterium]|nr:DUF1501 domain-containing protein [Akkermansiaceae bacterium]
MNPLPPTYDQLMSCTRRHFLGRAGLGLGAMALSNLLGSGPARAGGVLGAPHFSARAKRVIYLFQAGGPSHLETFDNKPLLRQQHGQPLPKEIIGGQRLSTMSGNQSLLPMAGSFAKFSKHGRAGMEIADILPFTQQLADEICLVRTMHTEAINHDPAITFFCSGNQVPGRPSMGAWASYGLGSLNHNLPAFIVLVSKNAARDQPLYSRLWGSGFLPSQHQGVQFRSGREPVLFLTNPEGVSPHDRRGMLDALARLNADQAAHEADPEIEARVAQAEMAFRMQTSVPDVTDFSGETEETFNLYGPDSRTPGTYAANCLLARRLIERDVRFVQLFHQGWDQHGDLVGGITRQCRQTDQASAALVTDLKRRGLLDDTLVVWGGEFGRTPYSQGKISANNYGRDHHPRCFSAWLAGGGVKAGHTHGLTDDFGYNILDGGVHVHDLHATMLHLMGIDHERLTYKFQGRYFRLTDIAGQVVRPILA